jgi:hypothetical protein
LNLIKKKRKFSDRKVHTSAWENLDGVENPGIENPVENVEFGPVSARTYLRATSAVRVAARARDRAYKLMAAWTRTRKRDRSRCLLRQLCSARARQPRRLCPRRPRRPRRMQRPRSLHRCVHGRGASAEAAPRARRRRAEQMLPHCACRHTVLPGVAHAWARA